MYLSSAVFALILISITLCNVFVPPHEVTIDGRYYQTDQYAVYDWSSVTMKIQFTGSDSTPMIFLEDVGSFYNVFLRENNPFGDLICEEVLKTQNSTQKVGYPLCFGTAVGKLNPSQTYFLVVEKRTEARMGMIKFYGFQFFGESKSVARKPALKLSNNLKRIEFIGDSITCGYGNEGIPPCNYTADTQNVHKSFVSVAARELDLDYRIACWSGKGMVRNVGDKNTTSKNPFPIYYNRICANDASKIHDFSSWIADYVVISLGTNDFSTSPQPSYTEFSRGYHNFIDRVQENYKENKNLKIFCVCVPGVNCYKGFISRIAAERRAKGQSNVFFISMEGLFDNDPDCQNNGCMGCHNHPNAIGDMKMAHALAEGIRQQLKKIKSN